MKTLIAFYSRAGENYFGGAYRRISVGNTEQAARMLAGSHRCGHAAHRAGAAVLRGLQGLRR